MTQTATRKLTGWEKTEGGLHATFETSFGGLKLTGTTRAFGWETTGTTDEALELLGLIGREQEARMEMKAAADEAFETAIYEQRTTGERTST